MKTMIETFNENIQVRYIEWFKFRPFISYKEVSVILVNRTLFVNYFFSIFDDIIVVR